jgi:hypothetical protein
VKRLRLGIGAVIVVGLVWLFYATWPMSGPDLVAARHAPRTRSPEEVQRSEQVDKWIATALNRPLFSANRRPAVEAPSLAVADVPPALPRLTAILVGPFGKEAVFVLSDGTGKAVTVHENERAGPYRIRQITPGAVVVEGPQGVATLHPVFNRPGPDGQQPSASQRAATMVSGRRLAEI